MKYSIPDTWQLVALGEKGAFLNGLTYSLQDIDKNGVLVLRSSNIQNRKIALENNVFVKVKAEDYNPVKEGDILICVRNGSKSLIGKSALINKKNEGVAFGAFMSIYRSRYNDYIFQLFDTSVIKREIHRNLGATINSINGSDLKKFVIPFPPRIEQKKIADILSTCDEVIEKNEKLIELKKKLKKGLMQQLLTSKRKKHNISDIKTIELGHISKIKTGDKDNKDKQKAGKYPFFVRSENIERIGSYTYDGEAILIPGDGKIGEIFHYIVGKFDYHQRVYKISDFCPTVLGKYIYYYLQQNFLKEAMTYTAKATVDSLRMPIFLKMGIDLPKYDEQKKITTLLSTADKEIELLSKKVAVLKKQKKGLMQKLLTGKIRVIR